MIKIGITGGIGSGKSTVCKVFASLGIPINDADSLAKRIITEDKELKESIITNFGKEAYFPDNTYNRNYISNIVFNDKDKLALLNELVHPKVIEYSNSWAEKFSHEPYVIKEAALMFESGSYKHNDFNLLVESPVELRIKRICERDSISEDMALKKINSQMSDSDRRKLADAIIINDEQHSLIAQIVQIHQNIISKNDPR